MTDTELIEKARAVVRSESFIREPVSLIAAALKEVAEETVKADRLTRDAEMVEEIERLEAKLTLPVGEEEVREALENTDGCMDERGVTAWTARVLARDLRSKTAALAEAEAKLAALEKKA